MWVARADVVGFGVLALGICSCGSNGNVESNANDMLAFDRPLSPGYVLEPKVADTTEIQLPAGSMPAAIAGNMMNGTLVLADVGSRTVLRVRSDGTILGPSWTTDDRDALSAVTGIASDDSTGAVIVASMGRGELIRFDSAGQVLRFDVPPPVSAGGLGSQISAQGSVVAETWFYLDRTTPSNDWTEALPVARLWDLRGEYLGGYGRVQPHAGFALTAAVNRGIVGLSQDTLWFARRSDGKILAYALSNPSSLPSRVIELPLLYNANTPYESSDAWRNPVVDEHLRAFTVGWDGRFYIGQVEGWAIDSRGLRLPSTVITVLNRSGARAGMVRVVGEIRDLAVTREGVFALIIDGSRRRRVVRYDFESFNRS